MVNPRRPGLQPGRTGNQLLDRLPEEAFAAFVPHLVPAPLILRQALIQPDEPVRHVYFPTTALVSTIVVMEDGGEVETGIVGSEGVVGLSAALGLDFGLHRSICQVPGEAFRLPAPVFSEAVDRSRALDLLIRRYAGVLLRQTEQAVACNALHPVTERLCRWLLMSHDRVGRDDFPMTQEFMAEQLGVRRQTVTVVAGTLQGAGLITFRRGAIRIVDRRGLEEATCECYGHMKGLYDRVFP